MDGIDCAGCVAHVGIDDDRKKLFEFTMDRYNKLDILVSNAAVNPHNGDMTTCSQSQWEKLISVNVS